MKDVKDVLRLARSASAADRVMVTVVVQPGNPVSDGLGHVFQAGQSFQLPRALARHMIKIKRVKPVTATKAT